MSTVGSRSATFNEDSNGIDSVNMGNCPRKGASRHWDKKGASRLDSAFNALYRSIEMSPDSQLGRNPPDSQLERCVPGPPASEKNSEDVRICPHVSEVEMRTPLHSTALHSTPLHSTDVSDNVGGTDVAIAEDGPPTFPDTSGKPEDTMLYGYYLPHRDLMVGNKGHALSARFVWKRNFSHLVAQPLDGVAVWTLRGGQAVVRTVIRNFFTGAYTVLDRFPSFGIISDSKMV